MPDNFQLFGPARWTTPDGTRTFRFAASMIAEVHERRIVVRRRPYLDGAPLDDTGEEPGAYDVVLLFTNNHGVGGVPDPAYPDYHRESLEALRRKGTSTLYVPGRGERRVRIKRVATTQIPNERDCEAISISVLEDKEDERATAGSFAMPSAKTAGPVFARAIDSGAQPIGLAGDLLDQITFAMTKLTAAINAPFDSAAEIQGRAAALTGATDRLTSAITTGPQRLGTLPIAGPEAAPVLLGIELLRDNASSQTTAAFGAGSIRQRRFGQMLSIFDIATRIGQDPNDLMRLNSRLPSQFAIPPGTPVWTRS